MSDVLFWMVFFLVAVGAAVVLGLVQTGVEAAIRRHVDRAQQLPLPPQISHCRTVPGPREESSHR